MEKIKDGGPAFPIQRQEFQIGQSGVGVINAREGMSLRDWFAGMALQGILASSTTLLDDNQKEIALDAYLLAEAMIFEKETDNV